MKESEIDVSAVEEAVRKAGEVLLSFWPGGPSQSLGLRVTDKSNGTPVSEADYASNELLISFLRDNFPGDGILSEEVAPDSQQLSQSSRVWILDPLDGTKSFIAGRDDFSVLLSLWTHNQAELGFMYFPARALMAVGRRGEYSILNNVRIRVSGSDTLRSRGVYVRNSSVVDENIASEGMDSGLAFLKVANGELDGAILNLRNFGEWDIAAPIALIEGAGGRVTDEQGNPIVCKDGSLPHSYCVASNGVVHDLLIRQIKHIPAVESESA